ncbi:hypothetical protein [Microvirga brassicacearum]|uniref:Uncharacterized protein n=1 Tax=Microvirga brassicacearum TaxID=2580413 RepID=A0A5N3PH41_9HYPH|nr:hypothetical protein [Microvirga brassicacearum]KAB0269056.1 hypothetical protein FEZ63_02815 [Microvirga brassicacearum]
MATAKTTAEAAPAGNGPPTTEVEKNAAAEALKVSDTAVAKTKDDEPAANAAPSRDLDEGFVLARPARFEGDLPSYWTDGDYAVAGWTWEIQKALVYPTKASAKEALNGPAAGENAKAVAHRP